MARTRLRRWLACAAAAALALVAAGCAGGGPAAEADAAPEALTAYAGLPVTFVENHGQTDPDVRYYARGSRHAISFRRDEVVLALAKDSRGVALALRFVGASPHAVPAGELRAPGTVSYLRGDDPARWHTGLPTYAGVVYRGLWPGVDLALRDAGGKLKYEFRVRPGARPEDVRLAYAGADGLALDDTGALVIETPLGELRDSPPVSYHLVGGRRVPVESRYVLDGTEYGFALGAGYRPDRELVIDPGLDYSTFLGGTSHERADGIAVDGAGSAYVVGTTQSDDFPTTPGAFDRSFAGGVVDVFVSKLSADGSSLVYSTYLGGVPTPLRRGTGEPIEFGRGIAVDADGHAYVTGQTSSSDFPTIPGAFDTTLNASDLNANDGFVAKLTPDGTGLVWSTFLGGTGNDDPDGIALDAAGNAYVTGMTVSTDFPTTAGVVQAANAGGQDAFVTKLSADGSALVYSTLLGGADNELATGTPTSRAGRARSTSPPPPGRSTRLTTAASSPSSSTASSPSSARTRPRSSTPPSSAARRSTGSTGWRSTRRATPSCRAGRCPRSSRPPPARSTPSSPARARRSRRSSTRPARASSGRRSSAAAAAPPSPSRGTRTRG